MNYMADRRWVSVWIGMELVMCMELAIVIEWISKQSHIAFIKCHSDNGTTFAKSKWRTFIIIRGSTSNNTSLKSNQISIYKRACNNHANRQHWNEMSDAIEPTNRIIDLKTLCFVAPTDAKRESKCNIMLSTWQWNGTDTNRYH